MDVCLGGVDGSFENMVSESSFKSASLSFVFIWVWICLGFLTTYFIHVVESGQLQMCRLGSKIRFPGQSCRVGSPWLHLKYFLQFSEFGISWPAWSHLTAEPIENFYFQGLMIWIDTYLPGKDKWTQEPRAHRNFSFPQLCILFPSSILHCYTIHFACRAHTRQPCAPNITKITEA